MVQLKKVGMVLGAAVVTGTLFVSLATWAVASEAPGSQVAVTQVVPQATPAAPAPAPAKAPEPAPAKAPEPAPAKAPATPVPAKAGTGGVESTGSSLAVMLGVAAFAVVLAAGARLATRRR